MAEDIINHPKHYEGFPAVIECIDITRNLGFDLGNAVKYVWRAGRKGGRGEALDDLDKALWYIHDWTKHMELMALDQEPGSQTARAMLNLLPDPPEDDLLEWRRRSALTELVWGGDAEDEVKQLRDMFKEMRE